MLLLSAARNAIALILQRHARAPHKCQLVDFAIVTLGNEAYCNNCLLENDLARAAPLASCFSYPGNGKNHLSGEIFHLYFTEQKKSVLLYLKTAAESSLGGFRVRALQVGILKAMETVKNRVLKGAVITVQCVNQKRADGIGISASFS